MRLALLGAFLIVLCGCAGDGLVDVTLRGKNINPGEAPSASSDGWNLTFERFDVSLNHVGLTDVDGHPLAGIAASEDDPLIVDLAAPTSADGVAVLTETTSGRPIGSVSFELAGLSGTTTLFIKGRAQSGTEQKTFAWPIFKATRYEDCPPGPSSTRVELIVDALKIFGDLSGNGDARTTFQSIADADTDGDGVVTVGELRGHGISGVPGVTNLWEVLEHQTSAAAFIGDGAACARTVSTP